MLNKVFLLCMIGLLPLQGSQLNMRSHIHIPQLFSLNVDPETVTMPDSTIEDFDQGALTVENALTLTLSSNGPWKISLSTHDAFLVPPPNKKPLRDLAWRVHGDSKYRKLRRRQKTIKKSREATLEERIPLDLRLDLDWKDDPANDYEITVIVTLSQNFGD